MSDATVQSAAFVPPVLGATGTGTANPGVTQAPVDSSAAAAAQAAPAVELTPEQKADKAISDLEAKIAKDQAKLEQLKTQRGNAAFIASLVPGMAVRALVGRGETRTEVAAAITGIDGERVGLYYGEGINARTQVVYLRDIIGPVQAS